MKLGRYRNWKGIGRELEGNWNGIGMELEWDGMVWNWNGIGVELEWNWNGIGMELECDGIGLGLECFFPNPLPNPFGIGIWIRR